MEVHHHPDLHHEKKAWKEYFLEFLMIFLAVSMGFFAETMRESISENGKAKELAKSLYQEVYADSVTMQAKISMRLRKDIQLEYFRKYVADSSLTHLSEKFYPCYVWSFILTSSIMFEPNDGILNQLRNSGTLRYFKSVGLQNSISRFNVAILNVRNRNSQEYAFIDEFVRPFTMKHFDFKWHDAFTQHGKLNINQQLAQTNYHSPVAPRLKDLDNFNREEADGVAGYYLLILRATIQLTYDQYTAANHELLQELRKEYHFEHEQ